MRTLSPYLTATASSLIHASTARARRALFGLVLSTLGVGDEARLAMRFQVAQGAGHVQAGAIAILRNVGEKAEVNK